MEGIIPKLSCLFSHYRLSISARLAYSEIISWAFPARWFDMKNDEAVLIGDEFWEKIGGIGTYKAFINAVNEIGKEYKDRIYREFLGIEPPEGSEEGAL